MVIFCEDDGAELVVDKDNAVHAAAQEIVGERGGQILGALDRRCRRWGRASRPSWEALRRRKKSRPLRPTTR